MFKQSRLLPFIVVGVLLTTLFHFQVRAVTQAPINTQNSPIVHSTDQETLDGRSELPNDGSPNYTRKRLKLPSNFESLRAFASKRFEDEVDPAEMQEGLADNHASVSFSSINGGYRRDRLLILYEDHIDLFTNEREIPPVSDSPADQTQEEVQTPAEHNVIPMVASCGGIYSPNNPYACCNGGNCTYWAWYKASTVWYQQMPGFNDAKYWAGQASAAGWPVSGEPGSRTISVSSSISSTGHVWFNEYLGWNILWGNEMNWCQWGPRDPVSHYFYQSNQGYIYPKQMWWRPQVTMTVSPTLWASSQNQWILFSGQSFTQNTIVDVTTPGGSMVSLRGAQVFVSNSGSLWIQAVLNARGWWKFRVVAQDGQRSNPVWLWVN